METSLLLVRRIMTSLPFVRNNERRFELKF